MLTAVVGIAAGCNGGDPAADQEPRAPVVSASRVEPERAGRVTGRIWWAGAIANCPPITASFVDPGGVVTYRSFPNPNTPQINRETRAMSGVVVMLEGVAPEASRPWEHPRVRVEIDTEQIHVRQGGHPSRLIGLARVGDELEMVSRDPALQVLTARGAAFFGLAFPRPGSSLRRRLDHPGLVELSSGAARYWHRAYVWVCDHPYITLTDSEGRFDLTGVPPGEYRLVAWHPSDRIAQLDHDPNTGMVLRYHFAEPLKWSRPVMITTRATTEIDGWISP